jgi:protein TonB
MREHTSAGHLALDIDTGRDSDVAFRFDREPRRLSVSVAASIAIDAVVLALILLASRHRTPAQPLAVDAPARGIVWLTEEGPGGGGGGGGNRMKLPPRQAELPGKDHLTVPVEKKVALEPPRAQIEPNPIESLVIPARELASALDSLPGALSLSSGPPSASQGSGSGGGAGTGSGSGIGPGTGSGLGPGNGGGTDGGAYRPGNGVSGPVLLREVKPAYTSDAMRARIQGSVFLECVVRPDGSIGDVHVIRSLDSAFGLDLEAIKAARQWRFRPGTRLSAPVSVLVTIQLDFALR